MHARHLTDYGTGRAARVAAALGGAALVLAGCGGSGPPATSTSAPTQTSSAATTTQSAVSIALTKCAATFHQIIVRANPSSDPAWVDEFKASFEHQTGSAIGREADLTFGALAGGPCDLVYLDTAGNLLQIFFIPGHTAFDGSSEEPVITGYNLQLPPPNVLIGPDGSLAMAPGS